MTSRSDYTAANRSAWDASAEAHEKAADWQELLNAVADPGFSTFDDTLEATLRTIGVTGRRAVQVCCNNGRELLSLRSLGALPELGIDQSEAFLDHARRLAEVAGSDCRFLCADIYDLPEDTPRGFDLGLITIGALNWMPDLGRFFEVVAGLLAEDGVLVIYETHPVLDMFDPEADDPMRPRWSYFHSEPQVFYEVITYDGTDGGEGPASYWFPHTMGEIVTSCVDAGLAIVRLEDHPHSNREVTYDIYENCEVQIPMCYTLVARKTG